MDVEYVYVDSRTRDSNLYPSGNSYSVFLTNPLRNIRRIDLVAATVPNSLYNYSNVQSPFVTVNSTDVPLISAYYTSSTLVTELNSSTLFSGQGVTLAFNTPDLKFIFYSSSSFTIRTTSTQAAQILGIQVGVTYTAVQQVGPNGDPAYINNSVYAGKYLVKSVNVADFTASEMVFLDIEEFRSQYMNLGNRLATQTSNVVLPVNTLAGHSFAVIPMDVSSGVVKVFKEDTDYHMSLTYPHVIEKLSRLTVNWRDINGNLLQFNNANNNSFTLRVYRSDLSPDLDRGPSLPDPVPFDEKPRLNMIIIVVLGLIGLLTILLARKKPVATSFFS